MCIKRITCLRWSTTITEPVTFEVLDNLQNTTLAIFRNDKEENKSQGRYQWIGESNTITKILDTIISQTKESQTLRTLFWWVNQVSNNNMFRLKVFLRFNNAVSHQWNLEHNFCWTTPTRSSKSCQDMKLHLLRKLTSNSRIWQKIKSWRILETLSLTQNITRKSNNLKSQWQLIRSLSQEVQNLRHLKINLWIRGRVIKLRMQHQVACSPSTLDKSQITQELVSFQWETRCKQPIREKLKQWCEVLILWVDQEAARIWWTHRRSNQSLSFRMLTE